MTLQHLMRTLLVASLLWGCTPSAPEVVRPAGSPAYPPTQYVEMLDKAPARAYEQLGVIEVAGEPGSFRAQVLAQVAQQAQKLGADAVILQDLSQAAPTTPRLNPTTGTYDSTGGQIIPVFKGIAIKYR